MKKVLSIILGMFLAAEAFTYDFTLKITPTAMFPFLSGGEKKYEVAGGGGFIDAGITFFDILNVGPEFGFIVLPKYNSKALEDGSDPNIFLVPFGVQAGALFYPFSRLELAAGVAAGVAGSFTNDRSHYAPWYRAYADVNFRINTRFSAGLDVSWLDIQNNSWFGNPGAAGLTAGLVVNIKFSTEKASGMVDASVE